MSNSNLVCYLDDSKMHGRRCNCSCNFRSIGLTVKFTNLSEQCSLDFVMSSDAIVPVIFFPDLLLEFAMNNSRLYRTNGHQQHEKNPVKNFLHRLI